jgi:hypothetical protein
MTETISQFPLLSKQYSRRERSGEEEEVTINGAKVVFDVEAELMPITIEAKKEKHEPAR